MPVAVITTSWLTVSTMIVTIFTDRTETEVVVKMDWDGMVVVEVDVVVVNTSVDTRLVEGTRVVLITVAMAKLVKIVCVLVKILYLASSLVEK